MPFQELNAQQQSEYPVKTIDGKKFYEYTVQAREGFYRIRVMFDISEEELIKHNPEAKDGLKLGMKLLIPVKTIPTTPVVDNTTSFVEHIVKRRETIFRIRRIYSITEEELIKHNPFLKERSLQEGDILKIPSIHIPEEQRIAARPLESLSLNELAKVADKKEVQQPTGGKDTTSISIKDLLSIAGRPYQEDQRHFKIAFLLPFMLEQHQENPDNRFVEFYAGALLAINDAKNQGRHIEVFTYDTDRSDLRLMEILRDSILSTVDLIVGPAYSNQVSLIGDFARMKKIQTIVPFSSKIVDLESNPYIYQFNPGQDAELSQLTQILSTEKEFNNVIFLESPTVNYNDEGSQLTNQLKVLLRNTQTDYQTQLLTVSTLDSIHKILDPLKENIVLFNTTRINTVSVALRQLRQLSDSFDIKIYEPYSWRTSRIQKPSSFYLSAFRNEYPNQEYEIFLQNFESVFNWLPVTEHPRYDLLGYDLLSLYFSFIDIPNDKKVHHYPTYEGIQSTIRFERASERGGYVNKQLNHYE